MSDKARKKGRLGKHKGGSQYRALNELDNPETIAILGDKPVYYHVHEWTAKIGLATAAKEVDKALKTAETQAKEEISRQLEVLNQMKMKWQNSGLDIMQLINKLNEGQIGKKGITLDTVGAAIIDAKKYYSAYTQIRNARQKAKKNNNEIKIWGMTLTPSEALDLMSAARKRAGMILDNILKSDPSILDSETFDWIDKILTKTPQKGSGTRSIKSKATWVQGGLGTSFETIVKDQTIDLGEFTAKIQNISGEFHKGTTPDKYNKSDTIIHIYVKNSNIEVATLYASDKTSGSVFAAGVTEAKSILDSLQFVPQFTANISEKWNFSSKSRTFLDIDDNSQFANSFKPIARYVAINSSQSIGKETRRSLAAAIVWSGIVAEITGVLAHTTHDTLPFVIRHPSGFVLTSDLLEAVRDTMGVNILSKDFIVQQYLDKWINKQTIIPRMTDLDTSPPELLQALYEAQRKLMNTTNNIKGQVVTYAKLKQDDEVKAALGSLNSKLLAENALNVSLRIQLEKFFKK